MFGDGDFEFELKDFDTLEVSAQRNEALRPRASVPPAVHPTPLAGIDAGASTKLLDEGTYVQPIWMML